jgi:hypothetical protein
MISTVQSSTKLLLIRTRKAVTGNFVIIVALSLGTSGTKTTLISENLKQLLLESTLKKSTVPYVDCIVPQLGDYESHARLLLYITDFFSSFSNKCRIYTVTY